MAADIAPPSGTVTFLFTDVEGSTRLWEEHPVEMEGALEIHDRVIRAVVGSVGGYVFSTAGDSFAVAFGQAADAVIAAEQLQAELESVNESQAIQLRVRVGLHTGVAQERDGDYFGSVLNRAARVMGSAHGGQVVLTGATAALAGRDDLVDLGEHRLADVGEPLRLFQLGGTASSFQHLRSLEGANSTLPAQRTSLIGRHVEVDQVRGLLSDSRLVTLTGVGGTGKTRLAIEVAARELPHRSGGVYFVDLARVSDPEDVGSALVAGLGLAPTPGIEEVESAMAFLASRDALIVVDNCEHLLDEAADVIDTLLDGCAGLKIVATTREALELDGERTFRVPSLAITDDQTGAGPAVRLFVERAVSADDTLEVDDELIAVAGVLCERLDGIPLAIELAAARVRSMGPTELLARLNDRFALLTGGRRGAQQRQRTLQATLDWSHDLLSAEERAVFRRLSVFVGDWALDAVASVAAVDPATAVDIMDSLVAKSLVVTSRDASGAVRYRMLETVRHYAEDHLIEAGEVDETLDRHCEHFVELVRAAPFQMGDWRGINSRLVAPESSNVNAAARRAQDRGDHAAVVSLHALGTQAFANSPGTSLEPAVEALAASIELADLPDAERGPVRLSAAAMYLALGRFPEAFRSLRDAVSCIQDPPDQWALPALTLRELPTTIGEPELALAEFDRIEAELLPHLPSPVSGALVLADSRSMALTRLRRYPDVVEQSARALVEARDAGLPMEGQTVWALSAAGLIAAHLSGAPEHAGLFLPILRGESTTSFNSWWYPYLARIGECFHLADTADIHDARAYLAGAAGADERTRIRAGDSAYLTAFARLAYLEGDHDRALSYLAETSSFFTITGAVAFETVAAVQDWPEDELLGRATDDALTRLSPERARTARTAVPPLLRKEIARWAE